MRAALAPPASARPARRSPTVAVLALVLGALAATSSPARAAVPLTGFLSAPMEQLAVPGDLDAGEITPEGDLYTGWAEYQPFTGPSLRSWYQPTRVAPDPGAPLYVADRRQGEVSYAERMFTTDVAGSPVVYLTFTARNLTAHRSPARVAMQVEYTRGPELPTYYPGYPASAYRFPRDLGTAGGDGSSITDPGVTFDPAWQYSVSGRDVVRGGLLLARGPAAPAQVLPTAGDTATSPHARLAYATTLAPRGQASWTWQVPLDPPVASPAVDASLDAGPVALAQSDFAAAWRQRLAGAMSISLPEPEITDLYRESLVAILAARDQGPAGWYQAVNKFQYQGFWLRDSSIMTVALDEAGLHATAGQNLGSLPAWQQPDGLYISQSGEYDGVGQALWEMGQHALLAGSPSYAASVIGPVTAAVDWIADESATDADGLLPPSTINDDEQLTDARITGDEIWAAVGLRSAISTARVAGRPDLVSAWQVVDRRFEAHLDAALARDQATYGHITPALDTPGGDDWGNYDLVYPMPIVAPDSNEVTDIIAWEQAHSTQGLADFARAGFLHDYLGFPIFQTELSRGGSSVAEALDGLYAETIHTTASGEGWEDGPRGYRVRASTDNLAPHGTFASQYVSLLHNLLVDDTGTRINLLAGVSPAWLAAGDRIAVTGAATSDGPVTETLTADASGATLRWSCSRFAGRTEPLYWVLPYWVRSARRAGGGRVTGAVRLRGDRGSLTLTWPARRPAQSIIRSIAELDRGYASRGYPAPLVPAADW